MIEIKFNGYARSFLVDLFNINPEKYKFIYNTNEVHDINNNLKVRIYKMLRWPIFDHFAIFPVPKIAANSDIVLSYNRFIQCKKPYVLLIENPMGPILYSDKRSLTFAGKRRLNRIFKAGNLTDIVCMSKPCYETMKHFYDIPDNVGLHEIPPLVIPRRSVNERDILNKSNKKCLECLYISSDFNLKGGKDIIKAFQNISDSDIHLTIITRVSGIEESVLKDIEGMGNKVTLLEFNLTKDELASIYEKTNILLNPTRQDSASLVTLEAMKYGVTFVGTGVYAINELVTDGEEGYLTKPRFEIWRDNGLPNEYVWNHRKQTIYSNYVDEKMASFLCEKILYLAKNRNELYRMSVNSFQKVNSGIFSQESITKKWNEVFEHSISIKL